MPAIHIPPSAESRRRLLRIGIIHGKRIVEERLVAGTAAITIGTSSRSTFIVPWDGVPHRWRLFEQHRGRHTLCLGPRMSARVARGSGGDVANFDAGVDGPRPIPLADGARGKITVGDTTVLFQLLRPPPPQPRARLPFSLQRRVTDGIDGAFAAVLTAALVLHVVLVVYLRQVEWPRRPPIEELPDRFVSRIVRTPRPAPPPTVVATTAARTEPAPSTARPRVAPSPTVHVAPASTVGS